MGQFKRTEVGQTNINPVKGHRSLGLKSFLFFSKETSPVLFPEFRRELSHFFDRGVTFRQKELFISKVLWLWGSQMGGR